MLLKSNVTIFVGKKLAISSRDKSIELHIKSDKYGKLDQGLLVKVSHNLVKRQKVHYIELNIGVVIIFAMNGQFWLMPAPGKNSSNGSTRIWRPSKDMRWLSFQT